MTCEAGCPKSDPAVCGLLLAAGRARRAGVAKLALPWPCPGRPKAECTLIGALFDAIAPWCGRMVVVVGAHDEVVRRALGSRRAELVRGDPEAPMFDSVCRGLEASLAGPRMPSLVVLSPGDCVGAARAPLGRLLTAARAQAVIPEHDGRGGHPVVIPAALVPPILQWGGADGLAGYWAAHPALRIRVPVNDPAITQDVDTLADYRSIVHRLSTHPAMP